MADSLGMALSKILFEHEPKLLVSDLEATAKAAAEVSNLLGCIMANVLIKSPGQYEEAFKAIIRKTHESAMKVADSASNMTPHTTKQ